VLDVWENEPAIDAELLQLTALGTPHIAGYSLDGKVAGTRMLFEAICRYFHITEQWDPAPLLPRIDETVVRLTPSGNDQSDLHRLVKAVYDICHDDARLRRIADLPVEQRPGEFDRLRKEYPIRREFYNFAVQLAEEAPSLRQKIAALGFAVED